MAPKTYAQRTGKMGLCFTSGTIGVMYGHEDVVVNSALYGGSCSQNQCLQSQDSCVLPWPDVIYTHLVSKKRDEWGHFKLVV